MVNEPANIEVLGFEFDQMNLDHLAGHGVDQTDIWSVLMTEPRFFLNLPDRGGTHVMIGPDATGQFFYISLAPTIQEGIWRPITGWRMNERRARRLYERGSE